MTEPEEPEPNVDTIRQPKGPYYGWWIVSISNVFHAMVGGLYHTGLSVYFLDLIRTFGITHAKLSVAFSLRTLEGGVEGPVVGFLTDRFGPRLVTLAGVLMGGCGFILLATARSYTMFLVVFLSTVTVGFSMQMAALIVAVVRWFRRRLGLAISLSSSGSAIGGFLLTPAVAWFVLTHGWRWAAVCSGVLILVVGLPLVMLLREPKEGETARDDRQPSTTVSGPPRDAPVENVADHGTATVAARSQTDFAIGEALRTSTYWLLALAIGLRLTAKSALIVHMVPILVSSGVSEGVAATLVALMSLLRLPSMIGAGLLGDLWSRSKVAGLSMILGAMTAAVMVWGPGGLLAGLIFTILFSGAQSSDSITWALVGQYFGRTNFGSLRGGVTLIQSLMSTVGPIAAGWVYDRTGSYEQALVGIGIVFTVAGVLYWTLKTPVRTAQKATVQARTSLSG